MDSVFLNVKTIHGFTRLFGYIFCYFIPFWIVIQKQTLTPPETLKCIVTTFRNKDKRVAFIRVDEYKTPEILLNLRKHEIT